MKAVTHYNLRDKLFVPESQSAQKFKVIRNEQYDFKWANTLVIDGVLYAFKGDPLRIDKYENFLEPTLMIKTSLEVPPTDSERGFAVTAV